MKCRISKGVYSHKSHPRDVQRHVMHHTLKKLSIVVYQGSVRLIVSGDKKLVWIQSWTAE